MSSAVPVIMGGFGVKAVYDNTLGPMKEAQKAQKRLAEETARAQREQLNAARERQRDEDAREGQIMASAAARRGSMSRRPSDKGGTLFTSPLGVMGIGGSGNRFIGS